MKTNEVEWLYEKWIINNDILNNYIREIKILVKNLLNWKVTLNTNLLWYYYKNVAVEIIYFLEKYWLDKL